MAYLFTLMVWLTGIGLSESRSLHEFHLSKCEINYRASEQALQIAVSIFIDDLELTMQNEMGTSDLKLCTDHESEDAEFLVDEFISKHLKIHIDGEAKQLIWVGKEPSEDLEAIWVYLEIPDILPQESIQVENDLLIDTFDDQQNIIKLIFSPSKKSFFLFHKGDVTGTMDL